MRNRLTIGTAALSARLPRPCRGVRTSPGGRRHHLERTVDIGGRFTSTTATRRATSGTVTCATEPNVTSCSRQGNADWTFDFLAKNIG